MPWRMYECTRHDKRKDGSIKSRVVHFRKWIKSKKYKPQKRGREKQSIYSTRFGYLELYNRKEQQQLICPSGYSISQCFNVLAKVWHGYHRARLENEGIEKMEKYARAIQEVQKDMGIKTTSFPHLGIYGDVLILHNKKDERVVFEDHSELKKKQEEYEAWERERVANAKKIQEELQRPEKEKQEELETFEDDVGPHQMDEPEEDEQVPDQLEPDEWEEEEIITMSDDIPFLDSYNNKNIKKRL